VKHKIKGTKLCLSDSSLAIIVTGKGINMTALNYHDRALILIMTAVTGCVRALENPVTVN